MTTGTVLAAVLAGCGAGTSAPDTTGSRIRPTAIGTAAATGVSGGATAGGGAASAPPPAPPPVWKARVAARSCIGVPGRSVVRYAGPQGEEQLKERRLGAKVTIDARSATWDGEVNYPILVDGGRSACLSGGTVTGTWPDDTSWSDMHDVAALRLSNADSIIEDVRLRGYGDAIRVVDGAEGFLVRRANLSYMRDDCIENDYAWGGTVQDSLLDGCYNAFSSRRYDGMHRTRDGSGERWLIRDSLVRLQPMPRVYKNRGRVPGHAGFFKWDEQAPQLQLVNNVFRADQDANTVGLDVPLDKLGACRNNIMVWLGEGPYPGTLPSCFTLTRDRSVWDRAVARWKAAHGDD